MEAGGQLSANKLKSQWQMVRDQITVKMKQFRKEDEDGAIENNAAIQKEIYRLNDQLLKLGEQLKDAIKKNKKLEAGGSISSELEVRSSNGEIIADSKTGKVKSVEVYGKQKNYIEDIDRFDLDEYKKYHNTDEIPLSIDILDLGYWNKDNTYDEPEHSWRERMKNREFAKGGDIVDLEKVKKKEQRNLHDSMKC